jgi:hypothetical protein
MTYEQLAERYDCSLSAIGNRLRSMGFQPEHRGMRGKTWTVEHRASLRQAARRRIGDLRRPDHAGGTVPVHRHHTARSQVPHSTNRCVALEDEPIGICPQLSTVTRWET